MQLSGQAFQNYTLTAIIAKSNYSQSVEVFVTREKFSALIQTEKLIYSPGDKLKFRVFVLDSKTRLHKIEKGLKFSIIDGVGGIQKPTELKSTDFDGVYEEEFTISESPVLGQWAIKISVGDELIGEETFEVTEVVPPRFYISMNTKPTTLLNENVLKLNVFAKYTHGIFVKGEALVKTTVQSGEQRWQGAMKTMNISTAQTIDFNLKEDLKLSDDMKERIFVWFDVEFAEALTGQKISRKHRTAVCNKLCHQIDFLSSKPKVKPGFNYTFQVQVLNLATMQLESGFNAIEVKVLYHFLNPKCSDLAPFDGVAFYETTQNSLLKNGIADFSLEIPKNTSGVTITATYLNSVKSRNVMRTPSKIREYLALTVLKKRFN